MAKPIRIQRKRTKGWRMPPNTVCISRPSMWGNPYGVWREDGRWRVGWHLRQTKSWDTEYEARLEAVRLCMEYFKKERLLDFIEELRNKNLCCWCPLDQPCHGGPLLELANAPGGGEGGNGR